MDERLAKLNERVIKSEFTALARELGVREDAIEGAYTLADKTAFTFDDNDNVTGLKPVIDALLSTKPFLRSDTYEVVKPKQIGAPTDYDSREPGESSVLLVTQAAEKARESGRVEDRVKYAALKRAISGIKRLVGRRLS